MAERGPDRGSDAPGASPPSAERWCVVTVLEHANEHQEELVLLQSFEHYEEAWQCGRWMHAQGRVVELFDPRGRLLIDAVQEHGFADIRHPVAHMASGTYRCVYDHSGYEVVHVGPEEGGI